MKNRLLISVVMLSLIGIVVISGCDSIKRSELQKENEFQKLKQAGLPTTIDELIPAEIPDSENGALVYGEAFKIKDSLKEKYKSEWQYIEKPAEFDKASAEAKKKVADIILNDPDFAKFYQLLKKASQMKCQFLKKKDYKEGIFGLASTPPLFQIMGCDRMLATKSRIEAESGMSDKALASCLTALRVGSASAEPCLIAQLVRMACDAIALDSIGEVINKGGGTSELYVSLIKEIDAERKCNKAQFGLEGELVIIAKWLEQTADMLGHEKLDEKNSKAGIFHYEEVISDPEVAKKIKKMEELIKVNPKKFYVDQTVSYCRIMSEVIIIFKKPYAKAITELHSLDGKVKKLPINAGMAQMLIPNFSHLYIQEKKVDAYLGAAEIGLADRLYKVKYGKYADSLSQLVPEFLQALPLDPFTGKDYIYKKKDNGFVVYSVAENLKDDGGEPQGIKSSENRDIAWIDKGN